MTARFRYLHAQKRSLSLDLSSPRGMEIFRSLTERADIILDEGVLGEPPQVAELYADLMRLSERLIVVAFSPFGVEGPQSGYVATELIELAASGWLTASGPGEEPLMPGSNAAACGAGTYGAVGVLTALWARVQSNRGQLVEVPSNEALLSLLAFPTTLFSYSGQDGMRLGDVYPFAIFPCADGFLGVSVLTQRHWESLCRLMKRKDLLSEPRFASGAARAMPETVSEIMEIIGDWASGQPAYETFVTGQARGVPLGIIPSPSEVLRSPHYEARAYWHDYVDPVFGPLRVPGAPYRASDGTFAPFRPAPDMLGTDTANILQERGIEEHVLPVRASTGASPQ